MSWECKECGWTNERDFGDCMYCGCVRNDSSNVATMNYGLPSVDLIQSNYTHQETLIQNISSTQHFLISETKENDGKCELHSTHQVDLLQEPDCADQNDKKVSSTNNQMVTRENFEFVSFENVTLEAINCGTLAPQIKEEPLEWDESFEAPEEQSVSQEFMDFKQEISDNLDGIDSATQPLAESIDIPQPSENMCEPSNCCESECNFETHNIKTESVNCDVLLNIEEESDHNYAMKLETETEVNEVVDRRADENVDGQVCSAASVSLPYCEANALVLKYYFEHCGEAESTDTISQSEYGFESVKSPVDISNDSKASSQYIKKALHSLSTRMKKMKNLLRGADGYFYCENCDRDIPIPEFYKTHIELFEERKHCKCALCGKIMANMTFVTFLKHMNIHLLLSYPKGSRCTSCKTAVFFSKYNLNIHELRRHPSNNSALPSHVSLNMSVETEYMTTLQDCEVNAPRFTSLFTELKKLVHNLVSGTTKLQHVVHCSSCSLDFPAVTYLNSHFAQCLKEGLFHCPFCKIYHRPQPDLTEFVCQMLQHLRRVKRNFECKECDKLFLTSLNHQLHSQIAHYHRVGDNLSHVYIRPFTIRKRLLNFSSGSGDPYDIAEKKVSRQKRRLKNTDLLSENRFTKLSSKFIGTSYKEFHTGKVLKQETEMIKSAELLDEENKS